MKYNFSAITDCTIVAARLGVIALYSSGPAKIELFDSLCKDVGVSRIKRLLAALIMQSDGHGISVEVWDWAARTAYDRDAKTVLFCCTTATVKPNAAADIVKDCVTRRTRGSGKR